MRCGRGWLLLHNNDAVLCISDAVSASSPTIRSPPVGGGCGAHTITVEATPQHVAATACAREAPSPETAANTISDAIGSKSDTPCTHPITPSSSGDAPKNANAAAMASPQRGAPAEAAARRAPSPIKTQQTANCADHGFTDTILLIVRLWLPESEHLSLAIHEDATTTAAAELAAMSIRLCAFFACPADSLNRATCAPHAAHPSASAAMFQIKL